jgi:hypothetical protein
VAQIQTIRKRNSRLALPHGYYPENNESIAAYPDRRLLQLTVANIGSSECGRGDCRLTTTIVFESTASSQTVDMRLLRVPEDIRANLRLRIFFIPRFGRIDKVGAREAPHGG